VRSWARLLRALGVLARRRRGRLLLGAAAWARAARAVVLAVLATVAGVRYVTHLGSSRSGSGAAALVAAYAVAALAPWLLAGVDLGRGRPRAASLARAGAWVLGIHAALLALAVTGWLVTRLA
jgi:hypothetical protein